MGQDIYNQLTLSGVKADFETLAAVMNLVSDSLLFEDDSDLLETPLTPEEAAVYPVRISAFFPATENLSEYKQLLEMRLQAAGIPGDIRISTTSEADYADVWKAYYHKQNFGRFTIVPAWEEYEPLPGECVIRMDPGQVFGAGTHETTRLSLYFLEEILHGGEEVLDIGTGSGILSIVAARLGAASGLCSDLSPEAVENANENLRRNRIENFRCVKSDLFSNIPEHRYDILLANIVAEVLLRLIPQIPGYLAPGGLCVLSGIIDSSVTEVTGAIETAGLTILSHKREKDWNAFLLTLPKG